MRNLLVLFFLLFSSAISGRFLFAIYRKPGRKTAREGSSRANLPASDHGRPAEKPYPFHPFLLGLFPALSLVADNAEVLSVDKKIGAIAWITLSINSLVFFLLSPITKSRQKAGAIASLTLLLFSSYGYAFDFLVSLAPRRGIRHRHLMPAWGLFEAAAVAVVLKVPRISTTYTYFLNALSAALVGISLAQLILRQQGRRFRSQSPQTWMKVRSSPSTGGPLCDIYYLIVDAHASTNSLGEIYNYDNTEFVNRLRAKGFFVAGSSLSNYSMTMLSLASSLNLDYLDPVRNSGTRTKNGVGPVKGLIEQNFALRYLKQRGYLTVFLGTGFSITRTNRYADIDLDCGLIDETISRFIQSTFLRPFADRVNLIENDKRRRVLCVFDQLGQMPEVPGPKFVFAHIASPQWPFLFNANGDSVLSTGIQPEHEKEAYVQQLIFIDNKLDELTEKLLSQSKRDPIIIIQGDHGPNFAYPGRYGDQNPSLEVMAEKMQILNAYHLPGYQSNSLYESISPVNTFRLVFNHYFDENFPILEDRHYYSTPEEPYRFFPLAPVGQRN